MDKVIYNLTKEVFDSYEKESNARLSFLDRLLTISGVLFGVLVSLYPKQPQSFECRLSFFLGVSLLVLGILMISIGRYRTVYQLQTLRKGLQDETESVLRENRLPKNVFSKSGTFFSFCEKLGYVFLVFSLFFLLGYLFLVLFPDFHF